MMIDIGGGHLVPEDLDAVHRRAAAAERKRRSRAAATPVLELPMPPGIQSALDECLAASGFDDARDFISYQLLRLAALSRCDRHNFEIQTKRTVTVSGLDKWLEQIGGDSDEPVSM